MSPAEITGVRGWGLGCDGDGFCLVSLTTDTHWRAPVLWANEVPTAKNTSGIYAYRPSTRYVRAIQSGYGAAVVGRVALLGHVVEHRSGYRAAGVVIRSLRLCRIPSFGTMDAERVCKALAARYQCEVSQSAHVKAWETRRRKAIKGGLWETWDQ